jgi:hypothetical protein
MTEGICVRVLSRRHRRERQEPSFPPRRHSRQQRKMQEIAMRRGRGLVCCCWCVLCSVERRAVTPIRTAVWITSDKMQIATCTIGRSQLHMIHNVQLVTQPGTRQDFAVGFRPLHREFGPVSTVRSPHGIEPVRTQVSRTRGTHPKRKRVTTSATVKSPSGALNGPSATGHEKSTVGDMRDEMGWLRSRC